MARPAVTPELFDMICDRIGGGESLRSICRDTANPSMNAVMNWLKDNDDAQKQYARAREAQADAIFDEILQIADDGQNDWVEQHGEDAAKAAYALQGEHIQRSRLRIDARKWMAGKLRPKVYGDKITTEVSGPDGGAVQIEQRDGVSKLLEYLEGIAERKGQTE